MCLAMVNQRSWCEIRFGREVRNAEPNKLLPSGWPTFWVRVFRYQLNCYTIWLHLMRCQKVNEPRARQFLMIAPTENGVRRELFVGWYSSCLSWPAVISQVWKARRHADNLSDRPLQLYLHLHLHADALKSMTHFAWVLFSLIEL